MEEALAIARKSQSKIAESRALVNLSDIMLRRHRYKEALDLARRSLELAGQLGDATLVSTSKANMGFALFGLSRVQEGKRLTDEALAGYERSGATAEIAGLLGEYGQYLERAGDHRAALALFHRERKLNEEIAQSAHERVVLELQEKYESDRRQREIELLNRDNDVKSAELRAQMLQQRGWWGLAFVFGLSFVIVAVLYRKLRATNRLLGEKNRELSFQSNRDPLTALYNRRFFQDFIGDAEVRGERRRSDARTTEALLLIDLDHFKEINDRYGHAAGDAVLVDVASRLRDTLRETDMIVRWGGEEFLVYVAATQAGRLDEIAAADHGGRRGRALRLPGHANPDHGLRRLRPDAAAAARGSAAVGARDRARRHGALPRQGSRPQSRLRDPRARQRATTRRSPPSSATSRPRGAAVTWTSMSWATRRRCGRPQRRLPS